jgi:Flp pilus assembly protein TadG
VKNSRQVRQIARQSYLRRGAVAVEMAIIAPAIVLLTCCTIDVGQYINTAQLVSNASREGARKACRFNTLAIADVEQTVLNYLSNASNISSSSIQVKVFDGAGNRLNAGQLPNVESGQEVGVEVNLRYDDIRWTNWLAFLDGSMNSSTTFARRE